MKGAKPRELKVIQGGLVDVPPPPKGLPADVHKEWELICRDLTERKLLNEAMLSSVEMYCWALYNIRECQKIIVSEGVFIKTKTTVKPNPASSMLQRAQETATRLAVELGLTPSSRARKSQEGPKDKGDEGIDEFI